MPRIGLLLEWKVFFGMKTKAAVLLFSIFCLSAAGLSAAGLKHAAIRVSARAFFAESEYALTFDPGQKGEVFRAEITLPPGAVLMDHGSGTDAKFKSGDTFLLTVPLDTAGKTVRLRCIFMADHIPSGTDAREMNIRLPLTDFRNVPCSVTLSVGNADSQPEADGCVFRESGSLWQAVLNAPDGFRDTPALTMRYLLKSGKTMLLEKLPDGKIAFLFLADTAAAVPKNKLNLRTITSPLILWDASEQAKAGQAEARAYLKELLQLLAADDGTAKEDAGQTDSQENNAKKITPSLIVFREKPEKTLQFESPEQLLKHLSEETAFSGTPVPDAAMSEALENKAGDVFFFPISGVQPKTVAGHDFGELRVHTFLPDASRTSFFLPAYSALTNGEVICFGSESPAAAKQQLLVPNLILEKSKINGVERKDDVFCISRSLYFLVFGVLPGSGEHSLDLVFSTGDNTFTLSMILQADKASPEGPVASLLRFFRALYKNSGAVPDHWRVFQEKPADSGKEEHAKDIRP